MSTVLTLKKEEKALSPQVLKNAPTMATKAEKEENLSAKTIKDASATATKDSSTHNAKTQSKNQENVAESTIHNPIHNTSHSTKSPHSKSQESSLNPNKPASFVHLHVHTHYSLLKSSCTVSGVVNKCVEYSQPAVAITDYGNMFGVLDLYFKAKEKGIKPILGLEIYLTPGHRSEKKSYSLSGPTPSVSSVSSAFQVRNPSLILLAQNVEGYRNLCRISTIAYQEGFYYVPRVDYETLKKYNNAIIALSGGFNGEIPQIFLKKGPDRALETIKKLKNIYHDRFYLQLNRTGLLEWDKVNNFLQSAGKITQTTLTAGNDVHYLDKKDHLAQDVLFCIGSNRTLRDQERFKLKSDQFYFRDSNEMRELFKDIPEVCDSTLEISSRCQVQFQLKRDGRPIYHLPKLNRTGFEDESLKQLKMEKAEEEGPQRDQEKSPSTKVQTLSSQNQKVTAKGPQQIDQEKSVSEDLSAETQTLNSQNRKVEEKQEKESTKTLRDLSFSGLEKRCREFKKSLTEEEKQKYKKRLEEELRIIIDMGFADYFLIVYDFVHWAKKEDIPVGPGRGSGASSLAAYCLEITDLDPMPYNLLFERFLNPERISLPDFDIDFCQENRNRVIEYVSKKYGKDYVAQVMTYGRLQARAAIRDVGRVLGMSYAEVDQIAKLIPEKLGITLESAIKDNQRLNELIEADPQIETLISLARQIEGLIRHVSIHAAGVIIADHPIINYAPLYRGTEGENIIQCDLNLSKKIGLVKFDFLGLKTLTQVRSAFQMITQNKNKLLSVKDISLEDKGIYEIMREGDTKGVFQFEGEGITDLIIKAEPSCFEDIVAINALFRPGPMDMIPSYLNRKKGKVKVDYLFPELEPILKETYGIIVYQEQVQLIAAKIAGYSYGEADVLRRAMGEKKPAVMKKQKSRFLKGARENGYDKKKSERLFDLVEEFAKYGFNKSHAAAYCVLAAQTAWLKKYYPVEFFASLLYMEINNTDKIVRYVQDAKKHNIKLLPPHINHSKYFFTPVKNKIYFSLGAIKGVGHSAVNHIIQVREQLKEGGFVSVQQFFEKVDIKKVINKKCIESLVKAGAFDGMELNRNEILSNYESFIEQVEKKKEEEESGQINLFSTQAKSQNFVYKRQPEWSFSVRLDNEKSVIGFYLSGHPMDYLKPFRKICGCGPISSLDEKEHKTEVCVWGLLNGFREVTTRKGTRMAFGRLEDGTGVLEVVFFSDVYLKFETQIRRTEEPLVIKGSLVKDKDKYTRLFVQEVLSIRAQMSNHARGMILLLGEHEKQKLPVLKKLLEQYTGPVPVYFNVQLEAPPRTVCLKPSSLLGVTLSPHFLEQIQKTMGGKNKVQIY